MKLFGWALILAGGGLIVVGVRQTLKGFRPAEEDDVDYEEVKFGLTEAEQDAVNYARDFHDLNDGV